MSNERQSNYAISGIFAGGLALALLVLLILTGWGWIGGILLAGFFGLIVMGLLMWSALGTDGMPPQVRDGVQRAGAAVGPMARRAGAAVAPMRDRLGARVAPMRETVGARMGPMRDKVGARMGPMRERVGQTMSPLAARIGEVIGTRTGPADPQESDRHPGRADPVPAAPSGSPVADLAARPVATAQEGAARGEADEGAGHDANGAAPAGATHPTDADAGPAELAPGGRVAEPSAAPLTPAEPDLDPEGGDAPVVAPAGASAEDAAPETADADRSRKPGGMVSPRDGGGDALTRLRGVGPRMEEMLHAMGIWHYDQIAGWDADEVAWMDRNLDGVQGRVSRDDWVGQARALAAASDADPSATGQADGADR